jgi:hypothetical protein
LIGDATGGGLFATENRIDLTNEINDAINRLQISDPNISWSDVQNVLIAAYCRVVSRKAGLTAAKRWGRMRQFVSSSRLRPTDWRRERCSSPTFRFLLTYFVSSGARLRRPVRPPRN